jgi:hypothetical protein
MLTAILVCLQRYDIDVNAIGPAAGSGDRRVAAK